MDFGGGRRNAELLEKAVEGIEEMAITLHSAAVLELKEEQETRERVIEWVRDYLGRIGFSMRRDHVVPKINRTHGLGLQSVSLQVFRDPLFFGKQTERLLPGQWKAPTIGIFSPDISWRSATSGIVRFPIDERGKETIAALSPELYMGDESSVDEKSGLPGIIRRGDKPLCVADPGKVVAVCHQVQTPEQVVSEVQRGVYACEYGIKHYDEIISAIVQSNTEVF